MSYSSLHLRAARKLVAVFLDANNDRVGSFNPRQHYRFFPHSIIMNVVANVHLTGVDDERFLRCIDYVHTFFELGKPENAAVDFFPVLKYWPFSQAKRVRHSHVHLK